MSEQIKQQLQAITWQDLANKTEQCRLLVAAIASVDVVDVQCFEHLDLAEVTAKLHVLRAYYLGKEHMGDVTGDCIARLETRLHRYVLDSSRTASERDEFNYAKINKINHFKGQLSNKLPDWPSILTDLATITPATIANDPERCVSLISAISDRSAFYEFSSVVPFIGQRKRNKATAAITQDVIDNSLPRSVDTCWQGFDFDTNIAKIRVISDRMRNGDSDVSEYLLTNLAKFIHALEVRHLDVYAAMSDEAQEEIGARLSGEVERALNASNRDEAAEKQHSWFYDHRRAIAATVGGIVLLGVTGGVLLYVGAAVAGLGVAVAAVKALASVAGYVAGSLAGNIVGASIGGAILTGAVSLASGLVAGISAGITHLSAALSAPRASTQVEPTEVTEAQEVQTKTSFAAIFKQLVLGVQPVTAESPSVESGDLDCSDDEVESCESPVEIFQSSPRMFASTPASPVPGMKQNDRRHTL